MITRTHIAAMATVAALAFTAAAPPDADACGFYSNERAVAYFARTIFYTGDATIGALAAHYPELERSELAMLIATERAEVRTVEVAGNKATALVEVVRADSTELLEVTMATTGSMYAWRPVSLAPAGAGKRRALAVLTSLRSISRRLVTAASARLARR